MHGYEKQFGLKCLDIPSLAEWPALRGAGTRNLSELGGRLARAAPWAFPILWLLALALTWAAAAFVGML
jgi:hypothetical protein